MPGTEFSQFVTGAVPVVRYPVRYPSGFHLVIRPRRGPAIAAGGRLFGYRRAVGKQVGQSLRRVFKVRVKCPQSCRILEQAR